MKNLSESINESLQLNVYEVWLDYGLCVVAAKNDNEAEKIAKQEYKSSTITDVKVIDDVLATGAPRVLVSYVE